MPIISPTTILSDVLSKNPELIPVVNRFGISLGVGDKTIEHICSQLDINQNLILAILNIYLDEEYDPVHALHSFDTESLATYFVQTSQNYLQHLVPNIERHLNAFIAVSGTDNKELIALRNIFIKFKEQLHAQLEGKMANESAYSHKLLNDLKTILIKHASPNYNQNLCHAVIFSIASFENDLDIHNKIMERVLIPKLKMMSHSDRTKLAHSVTSENGKALHNNNNTPLTKRETQVLILITQGKLNREIAQQLHISLNTVLTHRKHIIAKTGIKTVSGLMFYSIKKGLITPL